MYQKEPQRHHGPTKKMENAEAEFARYDFGSEPSGATGWKRSGDNRLTRHVYLADRTDLLFSVDFNPGSDTVAAAYAIEWEIGMIEPQRKGLAR